MSVTGTWKNSYGSVMALMQTTSGMVSGTYRSTTGSSGTYLVAGFANPGDPTSSQGESLALSIFWRSIEGGAGDPSWHWVSGLSGQMVASSGAGTPASLNLIHAMVATDDFPGLAPVGTYLDKLIYLPDSSLAPEETPTSGDSASGNPIEGTWMSQQDPATTLTLEVVDSTFGVVTGTLALSGMDYEISGFTDTYANQEGLTLQGLSVCALLGGSGQVMVLAGSLDYGSGMITLTELLSQGTASSATYVQTTLATLTFTQQT